MLKPIMGSVLIVKTLNDVANKLRHNEVATASKFVVIDSCKTFSTEKIELTEKLQLHWDDDQTPYFHFGTRTYQCHQGEDTNEYQKRKYAQLRDKMAQEDHCFIKKNKRAQITKKLGCPARVQVTRIIKIFEYKLTGLICKSAKDRISRLIKKKVADGVPIGEEMYVMKFPNQDDHKYHLQGSNAAAVEAVDQRVREHIEKLVCRGERNPIVVSKLLRIFVEQELLQNDQQRRRFYPDIKTVRKIISSVKGKLKCSPIDQVNTEEMLQKLDSDHKVFFRPCTSMDSGEENYELLECKQSNLLFVYQSKKMSHLYRIYGQNTILLDATYRTCKYALPLYFVVVESNVNYQIVGIIITQLETKESITEGLSIFKSWNPDIHPKYGMVDYAMEEVGSLEAVFPSMRVFICTFHREQAWTRWLSKGSNLSIPKQEALHLLRQIANAPTKEEMEAALQTLRAWKVYENSNFKTYFELTWYKEIERWTSAYKPFDMHINTNNGVERLNKELKYSHLEGFKNCSLSELLNVIIFQFLPERYARYVAENLMMTPQHRKYGGNIPPYLHGRPKWLIDHVITRLSLVNETSAEEVIEVNEAEGVFMVHSMESTLEYQVKFDVSAKWCSCTCKDFSKERLICKHVLLVGLKFPNWSLERINQWLFSNPVFKYDGTLITEEQSQIGADVSEISNENKTSRTEEQQCQIGAENSCEYGNIPLRGSKRKNIINDCNATMRSIQSALWYVEDEKLMKYSTSLKELFAEISSNISVDSRCGLPIEPEPPMKRHYAPSKSATNSESANQPRKKYKKLRLNKHKKASSGRVGLVADLMKSASQVVVDKD